MTEDPSVRVRPDRAARNLLVIMVDQLGAHVFDRHRHDHFRTPHLDALAARSTRFTRAVTVFPLCAPARSSFVTSRYPHQLGVNGNGVPPQHQPGHGTDSWGHHFAAAGFDTIWGGKWHATATDAAAEDGFTQTRGFGDRGLADWAADLLTTRSREAAPFVLTVSFDDPHSICEFARHQPMPYGDVEPVPPARRPPLPLNHARAPYAPQCLDHERSEMANVLGTTENGPDEWRAYRHAYATLVERVDAQVGTVLAALARSPHAEDTAVIFLADHGDGDAAHEWSQKTTLYQESIAVPFWLAVPGRDGSTVDIPVSAGLDLFPTACGVLGVEPPPGLLGTDRVECPDRAAPVVVQTRFPRDTFPTIGRSVLDGDWKYTVWSWGRDREQLVNLAEDPGELRNRAVEERDRDRLERFREILWDWTRDHDDHQMAHRVIRPAGRAARYNPLGRADGSVPIT